jgi:hypothetical protein
MLEARALEKACKAHAPQWEGMDPEIKKYAREQMSAAISAYLEAVGGEPAQAPAVRWEQLADIINAGVKAAIRTGGDFNLNAAKLREFAALEAETGGGETAYEPCGGCGNANPDKRCLGCLHPFVATPTDERVVEATYPLAVIVAASRIKRIFDGGCDRGDRDDFELLERHGLMDRGICSDTFGQDTLEIGEAMWTFNAAGDALLAALAQGESR